MPLSDRPTVQPSDRPTVQPSDQKKLPQTLPLSDLRRPTWGQSYTVGPILYRFLHLRANLQKNNQGKFFWSDGRTGAKSGEVFLVGRSDGRTADGWKFLLRFRTPQYNIHSRETLKIEKKCLFLNLCCSASCWQIFSFSPLVKNCCFLKFIATAYCRLLGSHRLTMPGMVIACFAFVCTSLHYTLNLILLL